MESELNRDKESELHRDNCLLFGLPCCPFPALNLFWKITIGATAILMLVFSITLFLMARSMDGYSKTIATLQASTATGHDAIGLKIDGHKQLTLENRGVTSEIKGMLTGWIDERRRGAAEIKRELQHDQSDYKRRK